LLTTEAMADFHANPSGTWLTHRAAREVYSFLGAPEKIAISFRPGGHEHGADGFSTLIDFADEVFFNKKPAIKRDWNPNPFPKLPPGYSWKAPATQAGGLSRGPDDARGADGGAGEGGGADGRDRLRDRQAPGELTRDAGAEEVDGGDAQGRHRG
jgi:hypothetical protein